MTRLVYLLGRAREAGLRVVLRKSWLRISPWFYYPVYRWRRLSHVDSASIRHVRKFGQIVRNNLRASDCVVRTDAIQMNRFPCLGYGDGEIPRGGGWHADQFNGYAWSNSYFAGIDFVAASSRCDVKIPWEYSRLQYLLWLADASVSIGDDADHNIECFSRLARDWVESNPVGFGVNWTSAMEVAIRSVNLGLGVAVLADDLDEELFNTLVGSLADHLKFIERFPEYSDVPGNHYLANLMGLCFLSCLLYGADSNKAEKYFSMFSDEANRQFEPAGGHFERAPTYHRLCLDMVAIVLALQKNLGGDISLQRVFERGITFCDAICSNGGRLPVFGDNDSGHVIWFGEDARDFTALSDFLSFIRGTGKTEGIAEDRRRWLSAIAGLRPEVAGELAKPQRHTIWNGSGFVAARAENVVTVMRVGAQGLEGRAPHDHDDSMSLWVFLGDEDLIVDAGCHSYTLDPALREYAIGSGAHNLVQSATRLRFTPTEGSVFRTVRGAATAGRFDVRSNNDRLVLEAELDVSPVAGFSQCRREVNVTTNEIHIADTWRWDDPQACEIRWHFGPEFKLEIDEHSPDVNVLDKKNLTIARVAIRSDLKLYLDVFNYDYSAHYGTSQRCQGLIATISAHDVGSATTTIRLDQE